MHHAVHLSYEAADGPIGIPVSDTIPAMQTEFFKELINKLAWALGTSYRVRYSSPRAEPRATALILAREVIAELGYGSHLKK